MYTMNQHRIQKLIQDIRENEVRELDFPSCIPLTFVSLGWEDTVVNAMSTNTSVSRITIDLSRATGLFDYRRLLPYLQNTQHLRRFTLKTGQGSGYSRLIGKILKAVNQNSGVEELELEGVNEPLNDVVTALQTFRILTLRGNFDDSSVLDIGPAIQRNPRLETLNFHIQSANAWAAVLQHLKTHPSLKTVSLYGRRMAPYPEALSSLVSCTTSLQILRLNDWDFTDETMQQAVTALRANQSITDLSLTCCRLTGNAASQWVDFMRSGDASGMRRLTLSLRYGVQISATERVEFLASPSLLPSLEMLSLPLLSIRDSNRVLASIGENARNCRLRHLDLGLEDWYDYMEGLTTFITKAVYLAELTAIGLLQYERNIRAVVPALKTNGSLTRVALERPGREADKREAKRIAAYCQRNAAMTSFLTSIRSGRQVDAGAPARTIAYLALPSLLQAVQQAPETAPNSILKAMQALEDDWIGSQSGDRKRSASV